MDSWSVGSERGPILMTPSVLPFYDPNTPLSTGLDRLKRGLSTPSNQQSSL